MAESKAVLIGPGKVRLGRARQKLGLLSLVALIIAAIAAFTTSGTAYARAGLHSFGTWAASPQQPHPTGVSHDGMTDQTVRLIVHTSVGGHDVRIRLSNVFGNRPVTFGAAHVGLRAGQVGSAIVPGSDRELTFQGQGSVTIRAGQEVFSDPARLTVGAQQDLAVSLFAPSSTGPATWHAFADTTSFMSDKGTGDHTADLSGAAFRTQIFSWLWLDGVDVVHPSETGTIVAFGDSITDGTASTLDANHRWPDFLARRLLELPASEQKSVVDEGIGGNRVLNPSEAFGVSALDRLDRDVLSQTGVTHVILLEGINDIGFSNLSIVTLPDGASTLPHTNVSADQIIMGYKAIIARVHARGLKIFGGTLTPFRGALYFYEAGELKRQAVNQFVRTSGAFDGVIDFDAAIRDPNDPSRIFPAFDPGDHLHPNDAGYQAMANAIDVSMFRNLPIKAIA